MAPRSPVVAHGARFSVLVLLLLTCQSAGVTILATLTQRSAVACPLSLDTPSLTSEEVCKYDPVHLLATAEVIKLLAALLWVAVDVYLQCTAAKSINNNNTTTTTATTAVVSTFLSSTSSSYPANASLLGIAVASGSYSSGAHMLLEKEAAIASNESSTNTCVSSLEDDGEAEVPPLRKGAYAVATGEDVAEGVTYRSRSRLNASLASTADGVAEERNTNVSAVQVPPPSLLVSPRTPQSTTLTVLAVEKEREAEVGERSYMATACCAAVLPSPRRGSLTRSIVTFKGNMMSRAFWSVYLRALRAELGLTPTKLPEACVMAIPAVLYAAQNTMVLVSLQLVDPALFQLCYLIRILFLAIFMRLALKLQLSTRQCVALVLLTCGIGLAQYHPPHNSVMTNSTTLAPATAETAAAAAAAAEAMGERYIDTAAAAAAAMVLSSVPPAFAPATPFSPTPASSSPSSSGAASASVVLILCAALISSGTGVFLEVVFKKRGNHFHLSARNVHLAFFSIVVYVVKFSLDYHALAGELVQRALGNAHVQTSLSVVEDASGVFVGTFFQGFTALVWCLVFMQSLAGILLALVMKYSNNILKTFATSMALLISMAASVALFGMTVELGFVAGVALVLASVFLYNVK